MVRNFAGVEGMGNLPHEVVVLARVEGVGKLSHEVVALAEEENLFVRWNYILDEVNDLLDLLSQTTPLQTLLLARSQVRELDHVWHRVIPSDFILKLASFTPARLEYRKSYSLFRSSMFLLLLLLCLLAGAPE